MTTTWGGRISSLPMEGQRTEKEGETLRPSQQGSIRARWTRDTAGISGDLLCPVTVRGAEQKHREGRAERNTERHQDRGPPDSFQTEEAGGRSGKSMGLCLKQKNLGSSSGSCCEPLFPYLQCRDENI